MKLWRVSNYADLSGVGGTLASGRWHSVGRPIIYAAEHPAAAILEMLAHMEREDMPASYQMLEIEVDEGASVETPDLPPDWRAASALTRAIGDDWLQRGASLLLRVPSVLAPRSINILINPRHSEMSGVRLLSAERLDLDRRLRV